MSCTKIEFYNPFEVEGRIVCPLRPLADIVFIYQVPEPERIGSIIIPEEYREEYTPELGVVLSIGPGYMDEGGTWHPAFLHPGQMVVFDKTTPWRIEIESPVDGKEYWCRRMNQLDVRFAVLDDDDPEGVEVTRLGSVDLYERYGARAEDSGN